jgi:hypothetical protein
VGRLFQGIRDIQGTKTFFFVDLTNIPKDRHITYEKIVCDYKPKKGKITSQTHSGWRQIVLFRKTGNLNRGHHNIQNFDQHHTFYKRRRNDDDGHTKILPEHTFAQV